MKKELRGWISEYNGQGMEGEFWRVFQDQEFATDIETNWQFEGMYQLHEDDELIIFNVNKKTLWSGKIKTRYVGFLGLKKLCPSQPDWRPADVKLADWEKWFRQNPPLEAILKRDL
jgi:hypothetical protein